MEKIISRHEAIDLGKTHYFTGVACKRGHLAKRYVSTQNCIECQHPTYSNQEIAVARLQRQNKRAAFILNKKFRAEIRSKMIPINLQIRMENVNLLHSLAFDLAKQHAPNLLPEDVYTRYKPKYRGLNRSVYTVLCFPQDEAVLRMLADDLAQ